MGPAIPHASRERVNAAYQHRSLVLSLAIASYALVFMTFVVFEVPGLGIAHLFYLPVAALALTGGVKRGILAGAIAVALFTLGVIINPNISPSELLTLSTPLRFLTYATMGGLLGWFSARDRELVERLRLLAERDFLTGLPNTRAFEAAIARRFEVGIPFALLLGDMDGLKTINDSQGHAEGNDALRRLALMLGSSLRPEDEVARVGGDEFAVLTVLGRTDEAAALAAKLEGAMARQESRITFGWAGLSRGRGERALALPGRRRAPLRAEARARPAGWPQPVHRGGLSSTMDLGPGA
jgi:diguanylate cyclase (GGDEF)-like protein